MQCIFPQGQTTPERILSNPWYNKGFCEPNQYKAAIDRCQAGYDSCEAFIRILQDRVKIEKKYVAELETWCESSIKEIYETKEFGTNKKAWAGTIRASKEIADTHKDIAERIQSDVLDKMTSYKKENYGKSILQVKKIKEFERDFEKVQKSWLKLLAKVNTAKKEYHDSHRLWKKAEAAERIIESDRGAEDEQKAKVKQSVSIHKKETEACKSKYKQQIDEMTNARKHYEIAMKEILDRTHEFERKRLAQYKILYKALQDCLAIDKDPHLKKMPQSFTEAIDIHNAEEDIKWWNSHFGSDTNTAWPTFEDLRD